MESKQLEAIQRLTCVMAEWLHDSRNLNATAHHEETKTETTNPLTRHLMHAGQLLGYNGHVPEPEPPPQERPKPDSWFTPEEAP